MLKDRKYVVERMAANSRFKKTVVLLYADFLRSLFSLGDWFVTLTFRDRGQDTERVSFASGNIERIGDRRRYPPDPRLASWEPDSKNRPKIGPPVRDAALREIEHWLLELGWEAAGRHRQEIFDRLADGLSGSERRGFAKEVCRACLCCALLEDAVTLSFFCEVQRVATGAIG